MDFSQGNRVNNLSFCSFVLLLLSLPVSQNVDLMLGSSQPSYDQKDHSLHKEG